MSLGQRAGLAAALVVIIALGSHVTHWSGVEGLRSAGIALLIGAALAFLVAWFRPGSRMGGRQIAVHTHGGHGTRTAARHEAGHYHVAKKVGGRVTSAVIRPDGSGTTWLTLPRNITIEQRVAVDVAGHVAAGTSQGCGGGGLFGPASGSDFDYLQQALRSEPADQRAAAKRDGYALARRHVRNSPITRTANKLLKHGSIS